MNGRDTATYVRAAIEFIVDGHRTESTKPLGAILRRIPRGANLHRGLGSDPGGGGSDMDAGMLLGGDLVDVCRPSVERKAAANFALRFFCRDAGAL